MRSLVLDLRGNTGGVLDQAIRVAEKFLPAGRTIISQRGRDPQDNVTWTSVNPSPLNTPLVVLVNERTASASEVVAGSKGALVMDDSFLTEQLERMRRLTERMSQIHSHVERNSELIARDRDLLHSSPLQDVRDYRTLQSHTYDERAPRRTVRVPAHAHDRQHRRRRRR
jgi:hypothetical protein